MIVYRHRPRPTCRICGIRLVEPPSTTCLDCTRPRKPTGRIVRVPKLEETRP